MKEKIIFVLIMLVPTLALAARPVVGHDEEFYVSASYVDSNINVSSNAIRDYSDVTEDILQSVEDFFSLEEAIAETLDPKIKEGFVNWSATYTGLNVEVEGPVSIKLKGNNDAKADLTISGLSIKATVSAYKYLAGIKADAQFVITIDPLVLQATLDLSTGELTYVTFDESKHNLSVDFDSWLFDIIPFAGNWLEDFFIEESESLLANAFKVDPNIGLSWGSLYTVIPSGTYIAYGYDVGDSISRAAISLFEDIDIEFIFDEVIASKKYEATVIVDNFTLDFWNSPAVIGDVCVGRICDIEP